jgi:uncharacterized membrane protein
MTAVKLYLVKSISYRILSIIVTFVISYILTGNLSIAGSIASIDAIIKFLLYFFHEQAWGYIFKRIKKRKKNNEKKKL